MLRALTFSALALLGAQALAADITGAGATFPYPIYAKWADAYKKAEETRGEGDAKSAAVYASAFNSDPEFYRFYRSVNAYVNVFEGKNDLLVLDPDNEFFRYLKQSEK